MFKIVLIALLPWLVFFSGGSEQSFVATEQNSQQGNTGTLEKMIVAERFRFDGYRSGHAQWSGQQVKRDENEHAKV